MKKSLLLLHFLPFSVLGRPLPTVQEATEPGSTSISPTNINNNIIDSTIINGNDQYQHQQQQQPLSPSSPPPPHPSGASPKTTTITTTKPPPSPPSLSNEEEEEEEEESPWKWNLSDGTTPPEVLRELELASGTTANPELDSESEPSEAEPEADSEPELGTGAVPIPSTSTKDSIINDNVTTNIHDNGIHDPELGEQKGHGKFLPPPPHNNTITNNLNHPTPSSTPSGSRNPDPDSSSPTKKESSTIPVRKTYFRHLPHADTEVPTPVKRSNALLNAHADRIAVVGVLVLVPVSVLVVWMGEFLSRVWEERVRGRRRYRSLSIPRGRGRGNGGVWLG